MIDSDNQWAIQNVTIKYLTEQFLLWHWNMYWEPVLVLITVILDALISPVYNGHPNPNHTGTGGFWVEWQLNEWRI